RPEGAPDHGRPLRDAPWSGVEPVELRLEELLDGGRHGAGVSRAERAHDLFDEERIAPGALQDEAAHLLVQRSGREPVDHLRGKALVERSDGDPDRLPRAARLLARGREHHAADLAKTRKELAE